MLIPSKTIETFVKVDDFCKEAIYRKLWPTCFGEMEFR